MKFLKSYKTAFYSLILILFFTSCSDEFDTETYENSALVSVKLQAAPSTFSNVNIDIQDVQFRILEDENNPNAWVSLNAVNTGVHDITQFSSGQIVVLVNFDEVPSKFVHNIRLVYGEENSVVKDGILYDLEMSPTSEHNSVNVVEKQLVSNKLYEFVIEFDVDNSIEVNSQGEAELHPKMNTMLRLFNLF